MKRTIIAVAAAAVLAVAALAQRVVAQTPPPTVQPAPSPSRVYVVNPPQGASFFPAAQETGVWQGCGPAQDQGLIEDFNKEHPSVRIVQVFIDASIPCKAQGAHTFVIVYQGESHVVRRSVRYPMAH